MVMPFLLTCVMTMVLAAATARWWVLWLPVSFGVFTVVVASNPDYGFIGTALRVGMWVDRGRRRGGRRDLRPAAIRPPRRRRPALVGLTAVAAATSGGSLMIA